MANDSSDARKRLAQAFHDRYEQLAPEFGYETRQDTRRFDPDSPNGKLMIRVIEDLMPMLRAFLTESAAPAGWKLAPVEPTEAMCSAAFNGDVGDYEHDALGYYADIWALMLAAAPDSGHERRET